MSPVDTDIDHLLERYELILLDAYGVLLDKRGALPGARELIGRLNSEQRPYYLLTNSASRLPEIFSAELHAIGLPIPEQRIITSGRLLSRHFAAHQLIGKPCVVLGPDNSAEYVRRAGGVVVSWHEEAEVVVLADQAGFPLLEGLNAIVNLIVRRRDRGEPIKLLLCNPDLIYPVASGEVGITAGALAIMIEGILAERYPGDTHRFHRLGKPHSPIFDYVLTGHGDKKAIMIGDQLATDILGAQRCGIDSALVMSGIARMDALQQVTPLFTLASLEQRSSSAVSFLSPD
jgi:HAD superfamily hydrolase (TIGR01450 family)